MLKEAETAADNLAETTGHAMYAQSNYERASKIRKKLEELKSIPE